MLEEEGFEVLDTTEIFKCLLLEWESNPNFLNSQLYLDFLKYDMKPNFKDFQIWRDSLLEQKLEQIYTVEDLDKTLDEMDDINELALKLDEFSQAIFENKDHKKNLVKRYKLDLENLQLPPLPWYYRYYLNPGEIIQNIKDYLQLIADLSITFWFHIL